MDLDELLARQLQVHVCLPLLSLATYLPGHLPRWVEPFMSPLLLQHAELAEAPQAPSGGRTRQEQEKVQLLGAIESGLDLCSKEYATSKTTERKEKSGRVLILDALCYCFPTPLNTIRGI
eukprot:1161975-Pelagomonas_calceolata.AAC.4